MVLASPTHFLVIQNLPMITKLHFNLTGHVPYWSLGVSVHCHSCCIHTLTLTSLSFKTCNNQISFQPHRSRALPRSLGVSVQCHICCIHTLTLTSLSFKTCNNQISFQPHRSRALPKSLGVSVRCHSCWLRWLSTCRLP